MAKINFFEEEVGVQSMMRLILFITVANAILLTDTVVLFGLITEGTKNVGSLVGSGIALFTGLTSFIATLKLLQKTKENERSDRESRKETETNSGRTAE